MQKAKNPVRAVFFFEGAGDDEGQNLDDALFDSKLRAVQLERDELDLDSECEMQFVFVFCKCDDQAPAPDAQRRLEALQERLVMEDGTRMRAPNSGCWPAPGER
jgi:hypothetical protein